jgi:hypothetical protein
MDMSAQAEISMRLAYAVQALRRSLHAEHAALKPRQCELDDLIHEAIAREFRRARYNDRDRACYRTGAAFEPQNGHKLDDLALTGLDHLGSSGLLLLAEVARRHPDDSLSALLKRLFEGPMGDGIHAWGVWVRWHWVRQLYNEETAAFLMSKLGRDPKARWRTNKVTQRQHYLVEEISRALQIVAPALSNRGAAFDWIHEKGGNPRFNQEPAIPSWPASAARRPRVVR